uniref:Uncharacterized protein n=1 Tax=viral metagenome TaxID=1070528 RepID=A0A6C0BCM9_9ZZZZ
MSTCPVTDEQKTEIRISTCHYIITLVFFMIVLINTIYLTLSVSKMNVDLNNSNAVKAKNIMIAACAVSYIADFIIIGILAIAYSYQSYYPEESKDYSMKLIETIGGEDIYTSLRITVFSILMITSLIVGALCVDAGKLIDKSDNSDQYSDEYNLCKEMGRLFLLHFLFFTTIQFSTYVYQAILYVWKGYFL